MADANVLTRDLATEAVARIVAGVKARLGDERIWAEVDEAAVIDAVVDVAATTRAAEKLRLHIRSMVGHVERLVQPLDEVRRDLATAESIATIGRAAA